MFENNKIIYLISILLTVILFCGQYNIIFTLWSDKPVNEKQRLMNYDITVQQDIFLY